MAENRLGVFILCCNGLLRESLARILGKKPDLRVVAAQSIAPKSRDEIANFQVDVLVLDSLQFFLEDDTWLPMLRSDAPSTNCVLIGMEDDQKQFLTAVQYGVLGYVLREASTTDVVAAIRAVSQGEAVCPSRMTRCLFNLVASQAPSLPNSRNQRQWTLTRREQQLIPLISRGLTNKEIAAKFQLSEQTVKNHIHRILRKVGVADRLSVFEAYQAKTLGL